MKKFFFTLFTGLLVFSGYSQKIQVKKNKILFDKVEVAIVDNPFRDHLDFKTLSGEKIFSTEFKGLSANGTEMYQWLEVISADGKQKTEIPYEVLITSFDSDRIIAHLLSVKYNLIDDKGINRENLKTFFDTPRESLSDKYGKIIAAAKFEEDARKQKIQQVRSSLNPQVKTDYSVTMNLNGKLTIVGRMQANPYVVGNGAQTCLTVYDLDGIAVAKMTTTPSDFQKNKIETWDGKKYDYFSKSQYSHTNFTYLNDFLLDLVARDYFLNHQAKTEQQKLYQAKVNLAKDKSVNIYKKSGYLVDSEGKRYDGIISINFQMLDVNQTGQVLPEETADKFGKTVSITYKNEKNQERSKTFKANDNVYFCIQDNGKETFYYGMAVKGDSMKKVQNMTNLSFDNAYFYQLISKEAKIMLLQDPVETDCYVLKINEESKGMMVDRRSTEKLAVPVADYLKNCKALAEDIKANQFDLKLEENLITITKEYQNCK